MKQQPNFDFSSAKTPEQIDSLARHYRGKLKLSRIFAKAKPNSTVGKVWRANRAYHHNMKVLERKRRAAKTLMKALQ